MAAQTAQGNKQELQDRPYKINSDEMLQNLLEIANDVTKDARRSLAIKPTILLDKLERMPFDPRRFSGKELKLLE